MNDPGNPKSEETVIMPIEMIKVIFNTVLIIFCGSMLVYISLQELNWASIFTFGLLFIVIGWSAFELWSSYHHAVNRKVILTETGFRYVNTIKHNTPSQEKHGVDLSADEYVAWNEITLIECTKKISKYHEGFDFIPSIVITIHTEDKQIEITDSIFDLQSLKRVYEALKERAKVDNIPYLSKVKEIE